MRNGRGMPIAKFLDKIIPTLANGARNLDGTRDTRCSTHASRIAPRSLISVHRPRRKSTETGRALTLVNGLSDLHARQVRRASESVYYVFNSRVSHTRRYDSR